MGYQQFKIQNTKQAGGEQMKIATMIICCLVCLIANFIVVMLAMIAALKATSNTLVSVIEACEKADKNKIFMEAWHEHTK